MSTVLDRPLAVAAPSLLPGADEILTDAALGFVAELHERFDVRRRELLAARAERQQRFDAGELPEFREETRHIRDSDWTVAPIPHDLTARRVEITGPTNAKMVINALNSGARVFMADFEDATAPTWDELVQGQINLRDRWLGKLGFTVRRGTQGRAPISTCPSLRTGTRRRFGPTCCNSPRNGSGWSAERSRRRC